MKSEQAEKFDPDNINLAELGRRTGLTRAQLRRLKKNNFQVTPHALTGRKASSTIISGYTGVIGELLRKGVSNSEVCFKRIHAQGYTGSLTTVKRYIKEHKYLIPPKRQAVASQGNRGRRYSTEAGESYQMDWGFVNVDKIFTSNLTPDKWRDFFREEDSLLCALDRTFDSATVYLMKGESYRGRNLKTYSIEIGDSVE